MEAVKAGYNLWAESYESECNLLIRLEATQSHIRSGVIKNYLKKSGRALDIGCGSGRHIPGLESVFDEVVGIDLSEKMLGLAQSKCLKSSTQLICADFLNYSFPENSFDLINCSLALMHVTDLEAFLKKVSTLLAPGGIFYLVDASEDLMQKGSSPNFDRDGKKITVTYRIHTLPKVAELLASQKLSVVSQGYIPFDPFIINSDRKLIRYMNQNCLYFIAAQRDALS